MGKTVDTYLNSLKNTPTNELRVHDLTEFVHAVCAIDKLYKNVLFRGQSNKKWDIESSAYRAIGGKPTLKHLRDYHETLMSDVKTLHEKEIEDHTEFVLLAHLQHNYAKTCLLDYTKNPMAALWFACHGDKKTDAAVYCLRNASEAARVSEGDSVCQLFDASNADSYSEAARAGEGDAVRRPADTSRADVRIFEPPHINRRITSQQSVFLVSPYGRLDKQLHITIAIPRKCKKEILTQLALVGLSRKTLFPDLHGFVEWFRFDGGPGREEYNELLRKAKELSQQYQLEEALQAYREALALGAALFREEDEEDIELATVHNGMARAYREGGQYQNALEEYRQVLALREKVLGPEHPDTASTYNNIAIVCNRLGEYGTALEWSQKALAIQESTLGTEHLDTAETYNTIADTYTYQGQYAEALEWCEKALSVRGKVLGEDHPDTATTYNNIASVYDNQGEYAKALEWYQKALTLREKVLGEDHPDTAATYNNIASVYDNQGEYEKALEWFQKDLAISEKVLGKKHPDTASTYNNIAVVYANQKNYTTALEWYQKAYRILPKTLGKGHPYVKTLLDSMKAAYEETGMQQPFEEWLASLGGDI